MNREKCCGAFPEYVCSDCPHANPVQKAQGGEAVKFVGTGERCMGCFEMKAIHLGPHLHCPPAPQKVPPPPPPEPARVVEGHSTVTIPPAVRRVTVCSSCARPWNGVRGVRPIEGLVCGTCWQPQYYE